MGLEPTCGLGFVWAPCQMLVRQMLVSPWAEGALFVVECGPEKAALCLLNATRSGGSWWLYTWCYLCSPPQKGTWRLEKPFPLWSSRKSFLHWELHLTERCFISLGVYGPVKYYIAFVFSFLSFFYSLDWIMQRSNLFLTAQPNACQSHLHRDQTCLHLCSMAF